MYFYLFNIFISAANREDVLGLLPRGLCEWRGGVVVVVVARVGGVAWGNQYKGRVRSPGYYKSVCAYI